VGGGSQQQQQQQQRDYLHQQHLGGGAAARTPTNSTLHANSLRGSGQTSHNRSKHMYDEQQLVLAAFAQHDAFEGVQHIG
jgi:hypothetical protein